jgi:hypothetical protein
MQPSAPARHRLEHASATRRSLLQPPDADLIRVGSRRWFLQTGLAGLAGLSLPGLLRSRAETAGAAGAPRKAVILIWLSGGPSQLDTWDPKPNAPAEVRGPFASIATTVPGVRVCEHLPRQARILDRLALVRSVDCRSSTDHFPAPMQAGNPAARRSTIDPHIGTHPSMGAVAARFRGPNNPALPAFAGLADPELFFADVLGASPMGGAYEPVNAATLAGRLTLPRGVSVARAEDRADLCRQFDRLRRDLDVGDTMARMDHYRRQALDIVLSGTAERAFRVDREPAGVRDAYGRHSLGERTLLARRLIEAGVTFVTVSGTFGVFDNHLRGGASGIRPAAGAAAPGKEQGSRHEEHAEYTCAQNVLHRSPPGRLAPHQRIGSAWDMPAGAHARRHTVFCGVARDRPRCRRVYGNTRRKSSKSRPHNGWNVPRRKSSKSPLKNDRSRSRRNPSRSRSKKGQNVPRRKSSKSRPKKERLAPRWNPPELGRNPEWKPPWPRWA